MFYLCYIQNDKDMKNIDKEIEFKKLLERVIVLKDNLFGEGNWSKTFLPKNTDGCKFYIKYCYDNYGIIG